MRIDFSIAVVEAKSAYAGRRFKSSVEPPYRWRDWAAKEDGITGDELIAFINNEEAVKPDGTKGPGLFAYLRSLHGANGGDRRDVIATVFRGTINRMVNGFSCAMSSIRSTAFILLHLRKSMRYLTFTRACLKK